MDTVSGEAPPRATGFWRPFDLAYKLAGNLSWLPPLLTRIVIGQSYFLNGQGKWTNLENVITFFTELGIPGPRANATFVAGLELIGGLCLIVGLGTRVVSLLLSGTMVVALLTADRESFVSAFGSDLTSVTPVPFLLFLIWLLLYGPGKISVDHLIFRRFRRDGGN